MSNKNKNTKEEVDVTANKKQQQSDVYRKLPDNPNDAKDESISTADDMANGKYSKTETRKEDKDLDTIRTGN